MSHFDPNHSRLNLVVDAILVADAIAFLNLGIVLLLLSYFDSDGIFFMGWFIPSHGSWFLLRTIAMLIQFYLMLVLVATAIQGTFVIIIYGYYFSAVYTAELELGKHETEYKSNPKLRLSSENLRVVYRAFQVLHVHAMHITGPLLLAGNALFTVFVQFQVFVLIRYWTSLEIYAKLIIMGGYILALVLWTSMLLLGKLLFVKGSIILRSWIGINWGNQLENHGMRKFSRSCKPLVLAYGSRFVIRKKSVFVFYKGVTRGIFRALLAI